MGVLDTLRRASWQEIKNSLFWLLLNIFGGIIPIGGSLMMIYYLGGIPAIREPLRHGELALLSISLLASAIYVIARPIRLTGLPKTKNGSDSNGWEQIIRLLNNINFPGSMGFLVIIFILAISSTFFFSTSISSDIIGISNNEIIDSRIIWTVIILVATLITVFFVTLIENIPAPDAREMMGEQYGKWQESIEKEWENIND